MVENVLRSVCFTALTVWTLPILGIEIDPDAVKVPDGYQVEVFATGLSVPTTAIFDRTDLLVAESGFAKTARPRILRIKSDGSIEEVASSGLEPPVTGLAIASGKLFVSHGGKVSSVGTGGTLTDIVTGLPSLGDHHNNNIVVGPDGKLYMGQGTATNAGVVGIDNHIFGWLEKRPQVHEIPCRDITLVGQNFETENPLTTADDKVRTGAYKPFGTPSQPGEVIPGNPKCGGSIVRFNPDGSEFELVAWGLRNPFGLEFDSSGTLWATFHGADVRGSRNINDDPDYLVSVTKDAWYGWPEYFAGEPVTAPRFNAAGKPAPEFLWTAHPPLTRPFLLFDSHSGTNGIAISPGGNFGFGGQAFIAMYGTFAPITTGLNFRPVGFAVMRIDLGARQVHEFATNRLPGPSYMNRQGGFNRPSDVLFGPDGSLYVVDWGGATVSKKGLELQPGTGILWRIFPRSLQPARPQGPIQVQPAPMSKEEREPLARNVPESYKMLWPTLLLIGVTILAVVLLLIWLIRKARRRRTKG